MGVYWRVDQSILIFGQNFMSYYNFYCLGPFPCLRICLRICANESKVPTFLLTGTIPKVRFVSVTDARLGHVWFHFQVDRIPQNSRAWKTA